MASQKIKNVFALQTGTVATLASPTQLVGPMVCQYTAGFGDVVAGGDGLAGDAVDADGPFQCSWQIDCQDVSTFAAQLALFEVGLRAIQWEGREDNVLTVHKWLIKRAALVGASLSVQKDQVAKVSYSGKVAAAAASTSEADEIVVTAGAAKTATIGSGKRTYRIHTVTHGDVAIEAVNGLNLTISGKGDAGASGDNDFGESIMVDSWNVTGSLTIQDQTVATATSRAQKLTAAARGSLIAQLRQTDGSTDTQLTLANLKFKRYTNVMRTDEWAAVEVPFRCLAVSGTTPYGLASGANKIITMA